MTNGINSKETKPMGLAINAKCSVYIIFNICYQMVGNRLKDIMFEILTVSFILHCFYHETME